MKKCNTCEQYKELKEFGKRKDSKDGRKGICKICYAKKNKEKYVSKPKNLLRNFKPSLEQEFFKELNGKIKFDDLTIFSAKEIYWKCEFGHVYKIPVYNKVRANNCPCCMNIKLCYFKSNSLKAKYPNLALEYDESKNGKSDNTTPSGKNKVWWKCKVGHDWQATISSRIQYSLGCPFCSGNKATKENNLKVVFPLISEELNEEKSGITAKELMPKSRAKVWWKCKAGHEWETTVFNRTSARTTNCPKCASTTSKAEKEIFDYVYSLGVEPKQTIRDIIPPKELDIYIPSHKFAIEYNGLYWHSENVKDKDYHLNKTMECEKNGIKLFHIWEEQWRDKQNIVKSMICHSFNKTPNKIGARKLKIKRFDYNKEYRQFFEENHLHGNAISSVAFALIDNNNNIMSCLSIRRMHGKEERYEIARFASKVFWNIPGSFSRLLKEAKEYILKEKEKRELYSYAYRDMGYNDLYKNNGFEFVHHTEIGYHYTDFLKRYNRLSYKAQNGLTEKQVAEKHGVVRIYDCGNSLWKIAF